MAFGEIGKVFLCALTAAALASASCGATSTVAELNLTADVTIDVAAGSTTDVERVTGGAYTITKTGGGVVRFGFMQNKAAKLVVAGGHEEFYVPDASTLLGDASLHMDANDMNNDGYVEIVNGTNFITRWYQSSHPESAVYAKHDDYAPAYRAGPANRKPFVRKSYQNGLDVVDFGSLQTTNNVDASGRGLGHGAAMVLTSVVGGLRDVFIIGGFTEDVKTFGVDWPACKNGMTSAGIVGAGWNAFWPGLFSDAPAGDYPPLVNYWQNSYAYQSVHGTIWVNDASYTGADNYANAKVILPDGVNFINFRLVDPPGTDPDRATIERFARWGNMSFGGSRIGEIAAFARRLTDDERRRVENHLRSKWFAQSFADVSIVPVGDIEKTTGGTAWCSGFSATSDIALSAGTLVVNPLANSGTWIHLDASQIDAESLPIVNGKKVIDTWPDADGGSHYASHSTRAPSWRADPANRKPFISSGWASNNLNVVDFGYPQNPGVVDESGNGLGYGAGMEFDTACNTIREALMVVCDYEETKTIFDGYPNAGHTASMFLGGTRLTRYFGRFTYQADKMPIILNPWQNFAKPVTTNQNGVAVDGELKAKGSEVRLTPGMHLVHFRAFEDMQANGIGMDYANANYGNFGGVRIGEMLVYESEIDDVLRTRITKALMAKWLGREPYVYEAGRVAVEGGAVLDIPYAGLSAEELVMGEGTVDAMTVKPRSMKLRALSGSIDGELDLGDEGGTLTFDDSAMVSGDLRSARVLAASSVVGSVRRWSAVGTSGRRYRCTVGEDGLYCSVPDGLTLIFR